MYSMHIRKKLPTSVVDTVLASPDDYPALLWHKAEEALAQSARRFVRPVWRVASKEKWFAE
jgi:hypothetical protein